jgi:ADP-ribose pyrophosphatase
VTFTVGIGMGLCEGVLGREAQHQSAAIHVGRVEAERLMGAGREYGRGPLPSFLAQLDLARRAGAPVGLVLLCEAPPEGAPKDSRALVAPVGDFIEGAAVVASAAGRIPWSPVLDAIRRVSGSDPLAPGTDPVRFLLFGCHTEQQVLAMALFLRSILGHAQVAISPHLVGSATSEAHLAVLRHHLPLAGVDVLLDLREVADFVAIDRGPLAQFDCGACRLEPDEVRDALSETSLRILQLLCLHWTRAQLRPLSGGFSGSLLMLASGWKGDSRTEPMVIKVDRYPQMRREIDGYRQVKDLLGKHVPTFDYPVLRDGYLGVGMELAAMEGAPTSLQDSFEAAESGESLERYLRRLDKALEIIGGRLYRNTRRTDWISPYRAFHLHTDLQQQWLAENYDAISRYWSADVGTALPVDKRILVSLLRLLAANEDGVESDVCLVHGDLNFKNIICDEGDNVWFIDWTHCSRMALELDFAKLENDVKFVMSKQFDLDDLPRLRRLEDYFLSQPVPAESEHLPEALRFARWDLRFRKVLVSVRRIRQACFALKQTESWLLYRAALLKYALHTLSFDRRRGRGECHLPQLMYALHSADGLLNDLVVDDFQLKIRGERPASYPPRLRVSLDLAPWAIDCPEYDPPYHVEPVVLENDRTRVAGGWADPEDVTLLNREECGHALSRDALGRPLHPFGRTGIAGRGALGRWGPNLSVVAVVTRRRTDGSGTDILLGARENSDALEPPQGFVRPGENPDGALARVLLAETGWQPGGASALLSEGYGYDARRTDHAWVVMHVRQLHLADGDGSPLLQPDGRFESVAWYPLDPDTINRIPAGLARWVREAIRALEVAETLTITEASSVLAATG